MPKNKKISDRRSWSGKVNIEAAINEVLEGKSCNSIAERFSIPEATLRRYVNKRRNGQDLPVHGGRFRETFSGEQSRELYDYIKVVNERAFGLTFIQLRKIAFQYAERNEIPHRFNAERGMAGKDWIVGFARKWKLSLRKPESTSLARLIGFNKVSVGLFFDIVSDLYKKYHFKPESIYNADETGVSTVPTKIPKVFSPRGNRRVAKVVSAERGKNTTVVCAANAAGNYVPPFFVFGRVRMKNELLHGAPVGSSGSAQKNGWMDSEIFLKYLKHFKQHTKCSLEEPILLFVDNHRSHVTIQSINFARESGIIMVGFPPHTTHRLQPMDVSFFGPLKTYFSQECDCFMINHPGQTITDKDIADLFRRSYEKAATIGNAINGFRRSGICPFDRNIFDDSDFAPALTTDREMPNLNGENREKGYPEVNNLNDTDSEAEDNQPLINFASKQNNLDGDPTPNRSKTDAVKRTLFVDENLASSEMDLMKQPGPSGLQMLKEKVENINRQELTINDRCNVKKKRVSVEEIKPLPKAFRNETVTKRKKITARIITSTPVKKELEEIEKLAIEKEERKNGKKIQKGLKNQKNPNENKNKVRKKHDERKSECEVILCPGCEETYQDPPTEEWIQCTSCQLWWHEACSNFDGINYFVCDLC